MKLAKSSNPQVVGSLVNDIELQERVTKLLGLILSQL